MNRYRFLSILLVLVSIIFIVIGIGFNVSLRRDILEDGKLSREKDTQIVSERVVSFFSKYIEVLEIMSSDETLIAYVRDVQSPEDLVGHEDFTEVMARLRKFDGMYEDVDYCWISLNRILNLVSTDDFDSDRPTDFIYYKRPWYPKLIKGGGELVITDVYNDFFDDELIISIISPVMDYGQEQMDVEDNIGQVGLDIKIGELIEFIKTYQVGEDGFAVMFDSSGEAICRTSDQESVKALLFTDDGLTEAGQMMFTDNAVSASLNYKGEVYLVSMGPVGIGGWYAGTFIPQSEIDDDLVFVNLLSVMFSIAILIIVIAFLNLFRVSQKEKYIMELALRDPLTYLPNRRFFKDHLQAQLDKGGSGAVFMMDLDNFKEINDTSGHAYGDQILVEVGEFLNGFADEKIFVSRFGGDEFMVVYRDIEEPASVEKLVTGFMDDFTKSFGAEMEVYLSLSIGIALFPEQSNDVHKLITYADMAMYDVKRSGKKGYRIFDSQMLKAVTDKIAIEKLLRENLQKDGLQLVYQPQIDVEKEKVCGAEALLRFKDGRYSPADFIPVAEEAGLIIEMGRWVTEEVFRLIAANRDRQALDLPVSINFSPKQINDRGYLDFLKVKMAEYGISPDAFYIEITESVLFEDREASIALTESLHKMKIKVALDDFGTGFSSIGYLTFLHVDYLKLDKTLSDRFLNEDHLDTIKSIIDLGHSQNIKIVAEGIETEEQVKLLQQIGCDMIQGYYYAKPMDEAEFMDYCQ